MGYLTSASMLYAMALEAGFKGRLQESKPADIRFSVETDGTGAMLSASIQKMGVLDHDLVALTDSIGFIGPDTGRRKVLTSLTDCLVWIARYPVPRGVGKKREAGHVVSLIVENIPVRDLINEMLDELLRGAGGS